MTSYLNNGYDVMNCFAKFEKFLPDSIIIPSFMTVEGQMAELEREGACCPSPHKIDGQNTPYKLRLSLVLIYRYHRYKRLSFSELRKFDTTLIV